MTEQEYEQARALVENLMATHPMPDSRYGQRLAELLPLVEAYEKEHYPLRPMDRELTRTIWKGLSERARS